MMMRALAACVVVVASCVVLDGKSNEPSNRQRSEPGGRPIQIVGELTAASSGISSDDGSHATNERRRARQASVADDEPRTMDETVRLEFILAPADKTTVPLWVLIAQDDYSVRRESNADGTTRSLQISGNIRPAKHANRWLLSYDATLSDVDAAGAGKSLHSAGGSAIVEPGIETAVCQLGDKTLSVAASIERSSPKPPAVLQSPFQQVQTLDERLSPATQAPRKKTTEQQAKPDAGRPASSKPVNHFHHNGCSNIIVFTITGTTNIAAGEKDGE